MGKVDRDAVVIVVGELEVVELLTRFSGRLMVAELNEPHGVFVAIPAQASRDVAGLAGEG